MNLIDNLFTAILCEDPGYLKVGLRAFYLLEGLAYDVYAYQLVMLFADLS